MHTKGSQCKEEEKTTIFGQSLVCCKITALFERNLNGPNFLHEWKVCDILMQASNLMTGKKINQNYCLDLFLFVLNIDIFHFDIIDCVKMKRTNQKVV